MSVDVTVQSEVELPAAITEERLSSLIASMLDAEGHDGEFEVGVQFVDDATMQAAHREFMDIDQPTDIMTFPYEDDFDFGSLDEDEALIAGGDLMISVDRAAENAEAAGWSTEQELLFLVVHGTLHLLGWDDHSDDDRTAMLARQHELLAAWQNAD